MSEHSLTEPKVDVMAIVNEAITKRKTDPDQIYHLLVEPRKRKTQKATVDKNGKRAGQFWLDFIGTESALINKMKSITTNLQVISPKNYFDINAYLPPVGKEDSLWHMYSYHSKEGKLVRY